MENSGKLIVIEGVDGAGTTTQSGYIYNRLKEQGYKVHKTAQPSSFEPGKFIREILQKKIMNTKGKNPGSKVMSLLFAADRAYQQDEEIIPMLQNGTHVICDRYVHSSVIYQSVSFGNLDEMEWIKMLNRHIKKPDLVIYLKIDSQVSAGRRTVRGGEAEMFETAEFQQRLIEQYNRIDEIFPDEKIITLDAGLGINQLGDAALAEIVRILNI